MIRPCVVNECLLRGQRPRHWRSRAKEVRQLLREGADTHEEMDDEIIPMIEALARRDGLDEFDDIAVDDHEMDRVAERHESALHKPDDNYEAEDWCQCRRGSRVDVNLPYLQPSCRHCKLYISFRLFPYV